ncbi:hypothetical protein MIR68_001762 [Amoeboaphelidium protococcarum]|nr:hypothetical protein MIR68_001762 [Amoeboaphelidium protococcarum]
MLKAVQQVKFASSEGGRNVLKKTALYDLHLKSCGKMVDFAGWAMPLQYQGRSIIDEVHHTRNSASLFDVSHMLQSRFYGEDRVKFLESITVCDLQSMKENQSSLTLLMNESGGIVDDAILNVQKDHIFMVSNAGCADKDIAHIQKYLKKFGSGNVQFQVLDEYSLLALQGPKSASILSQLSAKSDLNAFPFMSSQKMSLNGIKCLVSRCGYTGEDGFEIQVRSTQAEELADILLKFKSQQGEKLVEWAGLGSRDTLRLEAGLCLYGHDIDETISPVEASLAWTISKKRRQELGFLGADKVSHQLNNPKSVQRRRVGLIVDKAPAREGYAIKNADGSAEIGKITSGCPSPTLKKNIAMGYVSSGNHKAGTEVTVSVRGRDQSATITKMPFVPSNYHKV